MASDLAWVDAILAFWFDELRPEDWFGGGERVDALIRARFGDLQTVLAEDPPAPAALDPNGHVAAVLVFDQFPRNLFRKSARAFATDALALGIACDGIARKMDEGLGVPQRQFLYMPLMHSEDRADQARSVALFGRLGPELLDYAEQHKAIIDRFGRFPHRNAALGRVSTVEEIEFLRTSPGFG